MTSKFRMFKGDEASNLKDYTGDLLIKAYLACIFMVIKAKESTNFGIAYWSF